MKPSVSNDFDAHQGKLWDEAGVPGMPMDPLELVLMAAFDAAGLSVNHDKSTGIANYTIGEVNDGVAATVRRDKGQWQYTSVSHIAFEPVSNLAYYGWSHFRDEQRHPIRMLAWPLHAIGDATVPMHVVGTSAWGHRPYEDSQEYLVSKIWKFDGQMANQVPAVLRVMRRAFYWHTKIEDWRASHNGNKDVPIRQIITELARNTYEYAMLQHQLPDSRWPFSITASTKYQLKKDDAVNDYVEIPAAADLARPLYDDGMGATVALLVAASDHF